MQHEEQKHDDAPVREVWEAPKLTVEDVESVTRGGAFGTAPIGDDGWYNS
jgi:hypothetical protein